MYVCTAAGTAFLGLIAMVSLGNCPLLSRAKFQKAVKQKILLGTFFFKQQFSGTPTTTMQTLVFWGGWLPFPAKQYYSVLSIFCFLTTGFMKLGPDVKREYYGDCI